MEDNKVAVLLEDLRAQFQVFGEGLQLVDEKINRVEQKVDKVELKLNSVELKLNSVELKLDAHIEQNLCEFERNHLEHQQIMQMVKELDHEVQFEIKRIK